MSGEERFISVKIFKEINFCKSKKPENVAVIFENVGFHENMGVLGYYLLTQNTLSFRS